LKNQVGAIPALYFFDFNPGALNGKHPLSLTVNEEKIP